jgi:hypothetical protein
VPGRQILSPTLTSGRFCFLAISAGYVGFFPVGVLTGKAGGENYLPKN